VELIGKVYKKKELHSEAEEEAAQQPAAAAPAASIVYVRNEIIH